MQTIIGTAGETKTTANEADLKALARVESMGQHIHANLPALKEIGLNLKTAAGSVRKHFEKPE